MRELALLVAEKVAEDLDVGAERLVDPRDERQPVRFLQSDQRLGLVLVEAEMSAATARKAAHQTVSVSR